MPAAAAARSFERTASNRRPVALTAMFPTTRAVASSTASTTNPNCHRATLRPLRIETSRPKRIGFAIGLPDDEVNAGLRNTNFSRATPPAKVTTASWAPRMRSAGTPITTPNSAATELDSASDSGNGTPMSVVNFDRANPAIPASDACANEI